MSTLSMLQQKKDEIYRIASSHGGISLAIFGSCARGDDDGSSDIDLLVEFKSGTSLYDFVDLKHDLEDFLHRRVDIISNKALKDDDFGKIVKLEAIAL